MRLLLRFQHTAARRRLDSDCVAGEIKQYVSTHSRPKAAGFKMSRFRISVSLFQHTAARRRLGGVVQLLHASSYVSTHSRPKAAGKLLRGCMVSRLCFNTQPPEGGWRAPPNLPTHLLSFNTQPPEGGWTVNLTGTARMNGFNTQPPEGGWVGQIRRDGTARPVSTHSRPKAAGNRRKGAVMREICFNTQPPEGGWNIRIS